MNEIEWDGFTKESMLGIRTYLMKDDPKTIPDSIKRMKRYFYRFKIPKLEIYTFFILQNEIYPLYYIIYRICIRIILLSKFLI